MLNLVVSGSVNMEFAAETNSRRRLGREDTAEPETFEVSISLEPFELPPTPTTTTANAVTGAAAIAVSVITAIAMMM